LLVSLDLSTASDTIDHSILLSRLHYSFGITDAPLAWIQSYLYGRTFAVHTGQHSSDPVACSVGVPQPFVLGPLLFAAYTFAISNITQSFGVQQQQYVDDTQLYIVLSPPGSSVELPTLQTRLTLLEVCFYTNGMALNPDKSQAIILGTAQRAPSYDGLNSVNVAGSVIPLAEHLKLLGVAFDSHLNTWEHTKRVSQSCFYHVRALRHMRGALDRYTASIIASVLVSSRLDYANSLLYGSSVTCIARLQRVQNTLAKLVFQEPSLPASAILQELHWLPVKSRIQLNLASLTYKILHTVHHHILQNL